MRTGLGRRAPLTRFVAFASLVAFSAPIAAAPLSAAQPVDAPPIARTPPDEFAAAQSPTTAIPPRAPPPRITRARAPAELATLTSRAAPQPTATPPPAASRFALAVNLPFHWLRASIGVSGYLQLAPGLAIRLNAAHSRGAKWKLLNGEFAALVDDARAMRIAEGAISLIWFPHRDFTGPAVEAGALLRSYRSTATPANATDASHGRILAARVALGWFWPIGKRWFASVNVGASRGYAWRSVNAQPTNSLGRDLEGFVRWGIRW